MRRPCRHRLAVRLPVAIALLPPLALALSGCRVAERVSEGAYRHAVADGSAAELRERGYHLAEPPSCGQVRGTLAVVHVTCHGRTADGRPILVTGMATEANTRHPREEYVISVGGRVAVRTPCLSLGCKDR